MRGLERAVDAGLARSPLQFLFRRRAARRLTVLAYHGVDDPERFALQLDWLARRTRPVDHARVLDALAGRRDLPRHAVLITFDDGRRHLLERGLPLLRERELPAVVFVVAGLVDTDRQYWWEEVRALVAAGGSVERYAGLGVGELVRELKRVRDSVRLEVLERLRTTADSDRIDPPGDPQLRSAELRALESGGVAVGNHTLTHPCLPRCSREKVRRELVKAHDRLQGILGHPPRSFAYPNGDFDPRAAEVLGELGYEAAFLFDHRPSSLPVPEPLAISRVRVNSHTNLDRFRVIVSGLHPALHRLRGGR